MITHMHFKRIMLLVRKIKQSRNVLMVYETDIPAGMTVDDFADYLKKHPKEAKKFRLSKRSKSIKIKSSCRYNMHEFVNKFWSMVYEMVSLYMSCRKKVRQRNYGCLQLL
ncbi:MAG: hypothetical protein LBF69_06520 [Prevotellaceae bacterium]|nr:hypothetical protein [Prevotellaceae bacterium]